MKAEIVSIQSPEAIRRANHVLQTGGLVAFPTDTVYGVASPIMNRAGIARLYQVKRRDATKAIAVLIGDNAQIHQVVSYYNQTAIALSKRFWPGPLTIIMEKQPTLPENLSPNRTIGVRMPNHAFVLSLLRKSGPLATTSANISGGQNPLTASEVYNQLGDRIELIIDGKCADEPVPSTVVDCTGSNLVILRQGKILKDELLDSISEELTPDHPD